MGQGRVSPKALGSMAEGLSRVKDLLTGVAQKK